MKKQILFYVLLFSTLVLAATRYRNITLQNSTVDSSPIGSVTPSTAVVTNMGITHGITNSAGDQVFRGTSCTTAAVANAACNTTITWPVSFGDTNYTAVCSLNDVTIAGAAMEYGTGAKTATTMVVGIINTPGNSSAVSGQLNCIARHDSF